MKQQVHHKLEEERKDQYPFFGLFYVFFTLLAFPLTLYLCNRIDAAIVRIAKQHRTIDWIALVSSVTEALSSRFAPNSGELTFCQCVLIHYFFFHSAVIKSRIEDLIQREYLMRDEDNKRIIHYCP